MKYYFADFTPVQKFLFSVFIIVCSFIIFNLIAFLIALPFFNVFNMANTLGDLSNPKTVLILKYIQIIQSFGMFIIPAFVISYLFEGDVKSLFNYGIKPKLSSIAILIIIIIIAIPLINYLVEFNSRLSFPYFLKGVESWMKESELSATKITTAFLNVTTIQGLMFNIFLIGLIPAFGEEFIFRGIFQKIFINMTKNIHIGIFISAFLFSAIHMQFYGFIPRFLLGAFFGYLFQWSGTIWLPIIAHFVNNTFSVVLSFLLNYKIINGNIDSFGTYNSTYIYTSISLLMTTILIFVLYKSEQNNNLITVN